MRREAVATATPIQVLQDRLKIRLICIQFFPLQNVVTLKSAVQAWKCHFKLGIFV